MAGLLALGVILVVLIADRAPVRHAAEERNAPASAARDEADAGVLAATRAPKVRDGREVESEEVPASPEPASEPVENAPDEARFLEGIVRNTLGSVMPGVSIGAIGNRERDGGQVLSAADGTFRIADLVPDEYLLVIDPRTLPDEWMAPVNQRNCRGQDLPCMGATCVDAKEGSASGIELLVFPRASVCGSVRTIDGEALGGIPVRLSGSWGRPYFDTHTDEVGRYCVDGVFTGAYSVEVYPDPATRAYSLARPEFEFTVRDFEALELPDLVLGSGDRRLKGRVVDQFGEPVSDIAVVCYRGTWADVRAIGRTDEGGAFSLGPLPPAEHGLLVGPKGYTGYRDIRMDEHATVQKVDLTAGDQDLGTIEVERQLFFTVHGRLTLRDETLNVDALALLVRPRDAAQARRPKWIGLDDDHRFTWRTLDLDQEFEFLVSAPDGSRDPVLVGSITSSEDATVEVVLSYP